MENGGAVVEDFFPSLATAAALDTTQDYGFSRVAAPLRLSLPAGPPNITSCLYLFRQVSQHHLPMP